MDMKCSPLIVTQRQPQTRKKMSAVVGSVKADPHIHLYTENIFKTCTVAVLSLIHI